MIKLEKEDLKKEVINFIKNKESGAIIIPSVRSDTRFFITNEENYYDFIINDEPLIKNYLNENKISVEKIIENCNKYEKEKDKVSLLLRFLRGKDSSSKIISSYSIQASIIGKLTIEHDIESVLDLYWFDVLNKNINKLIFYGGPYSIDKLGKDYGFLEKISTEELKKNIDRIRNYNEFYSNCEKFEQKLKNDLNNYLIK